MSDTDLEPLRGLQHGVTSDTLKEGVMNMMKRTIPITTKEQRQTKTLRLVVVTLACAVVVSMVLTGLLALRLLQKPVAYQEVQRPPACVLPPTKPTTIQRLPQEWRVKFV